jgi:hypothetical protein
MNPLDQLADISTPTTVSMWPLAWGYWVLIGALLALLVWVVLAILRYKKHRKAKYEALAALARLKHKTSHYYFSQNIQVIMKTLCAQYLPDSTSKTLHGDEWQSLIMKLYNGNKPRALESTLALLYENLYSNKAHALHGSEGKTIVKDKASNESLELTQQNEHILATVTDFVKSSFPCKTDKLQNPITHQKEASHV